MDEFQYRIHPAIGIARVGDAPADTFFIGPEIPGVPASPAPGTFKSADKKIRPQAARFRVWAYKKVAGRWRADHEVVTGKDGFPKIEWTVHLANRKASFAQFKGRAGEGSAAAAPPRNSGVTGAARAALEIDPGARTIAGTNIDDRETKPDEKKYTFAPTPLFPGRWPVNDAGGKVISYLGQLRTDGDGRLIVIGGQGIARTSSTLLPAPLTTTFNNDKWFDDVSDGPVTAKITFAPQSPPQSPVQALGAWVIVGPPDFVPELNPQVTLYDALVDVAARLLRLPTDDDAFHDPKKLKYIADLNSELRPDPSHPRLRKFKPVFNRDIRPILARAFAVQAVFKPPFEKKAHGSFGEILDALSEPPPPRGPDGLAVGRSNTFGALRAPPLMNAPPRPPGFPADRPWATMPLLAGDNYVGDGPEKFLSVTRTQYAMLKRWRDGAFEKGEIPKPEPISPEGLDQAALERCVGGAFCVGIEVSWQIRAPSIFAAPFRINHQAASTHAFDRGSRPLGAGYFSRQMALPWQTDFRACNQQTSPAPATAEVPAGWWPEARPVNVFTEVEGGRRSASQDLWHRGPWGNHAPTPLEMINNWSKFGFVIKNGNGDFVERLRSF